MTTINNIYIYIYLPSHIQRGLNVIISVVKSMHSTAFGDYEVTSLFQINFANPDETRYDNYREFDNIHLQHDSQTTDSIRTTTSRADYKQ